MSFWEIFVGLKLEHLSVDDKGIKINSLFNKPGFLVIKADWCGYCKMLKPEIIKVAKLLQPNFSCYVADGENLGDKIRVRGFPTIKNVNEQGYITNDYTGRRTSEDLYKHLTSSPTPSRRGLEGRVKSLSHNDIVLENGIPKLRSSSSGLLMIKAEWCPHCISTKKPFEEAAEINKNNDYYTLDSNELNKLDPLVKIWLGVKGFPTFRIIKNGGFLSDEFNGPKTRDEFVKAVIPKTEPYGILRNVCHKLSQKQFYLTNSQLYVDGASNGLLIIKDRNYNVNVNSKLNCYYIIRDECPDVCRYLGVMGDAAPMYLIIRPDGKVQWNWA